MSDRPEPNDRSAYRWFMPVTLRWADADQYGHVNNVVSYELFDTAVNTWLAEAAGHEASRAPWIGLVVETACTYSAPIAFPGTVTVGLACAASGRSSVTYALGVFTGEAGRTAAQGRFVHVYVDRAARRPMPLPPALAAALDAIRRP